MAQLADLVIDCAHPASLARFWEAVLDDYTIAPYDAVEMKRLATMGILDIEDDPTVLLEPTAAGPRIWFVLVPEPKVAKNRMHLDVSAIDVPTEITRLVALGAQLASTQPPMDLTVMSDPEGNEFCVISQQT